MRILIAAILLCVAILGAAEVAGSWMMEVETPNGKFESTVELKQDGEKLAGMIHNQFGDSEITGAIKENDIVLNQKFNFNGQDLLIVYTGKLDATGKMSGRFKFGEQGEGGWTATKR